MLGRQVEAGDRGTNQRLAGIAVALVCAGVVSAAVVIGRGKGHEDVDPLTVVLGIGAIAAGLLVAEVPNRLSTASFVVLMLAAGLLGPLSAAGAAVIAELFASYRLKTRLKDVALIGLPAAVVPAVAAGLLIWALVGDPADSAAFYLALGLAGCLLLTLRFVIFTIARRTLHPDVEQLGVRVFVESLPSAGLSILLVLAVAVTYLKFGLDRDAFALIIVLAFSFMAHLLEQSRQRAEQYVSLSWGVLAGLMQLLDARDGRAARHAAAVANYARDVARAAGMSKRECEIAHTAGLLHDIGHLALSDRVAQRERTLNDEDWEAIHRHPELGAATLKGLGVYGPVAEIVRAHHERPDGRGYPNGLSADQIPEIAKIIAVAECYDTLTARDTYRTPVSSFEALRELRRVAGTQLDSRYVEVLVELLSGASVGYRHADGADFDTELNIERRIGQAGSLRISWPRRTRSEQRQDGVSR